MDYRTLATAIQYGINKGEELSYADAKSIAISVLDFFGYSRKIIDNILEPDNRDIFYMLEEIKILSSEREETNLHDGRDWRIHYWILNVDRVEELVSSPALAISDDVDDVGKLYDTLFNDESISEEIWLRDY